MVDPGVSPLWLYFFISFRNPNYGSMFYILTGFESCGTDGTTFELWMCPWTQHSCPPTLLLLPSRIHEEGAAEASVCGLTLTSHHELKALCFCCGKNTTVSCSFPRKRETRLKWESRLRYFGLLAKKQISDKAKKERGRNRIKVHFWEFLLFLHKLFKGNLRVGRLKQCSESGTGW